MKYDESIDLSYNSPQRIQAKNTLEYSLHLDFPESDSPSLDDKQFIEKSLMICYKQCKPAFWGTGHTGNFFGTVSKGNGLSGIFNSSPTTNQNIPLYSQLILNECVMAAYHTIMKFRFKSPISTYALLNKLKGQGLNEQRGLFKETKDGMNIVRIKSRESSYMSSKTSSYNETIKKRKETINLFANVFFSKKADQSQTFTNIMPCYSDIFFLLTRPECTLTMLKSALKLYGLSASPHTQPNSAEEISKAHLDNFQAFIKYMEYGINKIDNKTDRAYLLYKYEKLFGYRLLTCLFENMRLLKKADPLTYSYMTLGTLSTCYNLPNVFSRCHFVQYTFDTLKGRPQSYTSFFESLRLPVGFYIADERFIFAITKWLEQYEKFCSYMSNMLFPVYEWYFLITILEAAEKYEEKEATEKRGLHKLQELLAQYIDEHYDAIINPLRGTELEKSSINPEVTLGLNTPIQELSPELVYSYFERFGANNSSIGMPAINKNYFHIKSPATSNPNTYFYTNLIDAYIKAVTYPRELPKDK